MSSFSFNQRNIDSLIEISKDAGDAIMKVYHSNFLVKSKRDSSPLTEADILSNQIICSGLSRLNPKIPILSEECSDISFSERSKWTDYWLIDPLDGTKEFINRNGEFTVNIAFISNHKPLFGLIHAPAINETFWGSYEGSYFLNSDHISDKEKIRVLIDPSEPLKIIASRSHPSEKLSSLLQKLDVYKLSNVGSSLKFCEIARSNSNIYPRFGPTSEWDIAAGDAILTFAGGGLLSLEGEIIKYNSKKDYINPNFVAYSEKRLGDIILKKIKECG
tara:strand:- start:966 stop:1790 length:825 start_codon:yes stop_codon:yes gene_type:complete